MKRILIFLFFLFHSFLFSQANATNSNIKVVYNVYRALDIPYKFQAILYIQNNVSIWQELQNSRLLWDEKPIADNLKGMQIEKDAFKVDASPCIKTDLVKKEIIFHGGILKNWFVVKDNFIDITWEITPETKKLSGYNCIKAKGNYRGRDWIVWFTPDIKLSFGPWKLRGLPGLIIEAADTSETYIYKAEKIEPLNDNTIFKKDFASLMPVKSTTPMSFQKLLADAEEAEENAMRELSQKYNVVTTKTDTPRQKQEEIKYEWE